MIRIKHFDAWLTTAKVPFVLLKKHQNDKKAVFVAASHAQKAADLLHAYFVYRIASIPLWRITFSSASAAPVGCFAPRSNCEMYPTVTLR